MTDTLVLDEYASAGEAAALAMDNRGPAVIGQHGSLSGESKFYDEAYIAERCRTIAVAIDARAQHFPDETPYAYSPLANDVERNRYNDQTRETVLRNYNRRDLGIE